MLPWVHTQERTLWAILKIICKRRRILHCDEGLIQQKEKNVLILSLIRKVK